jgi:hypothetical protein
MTDDKPNPKQAAAQRLQESLERVRNARAKNGPGTHGPADQGGKGPKPNTPKGRIFRHQGR